LTTSETTIAARPEAQGPADILTLFNAGVHFGHPTKRWNPKMRRYIFTKRRGGHIIDLAKTVTALEEAKQYIAKVVGNGGQCLMVGTKKQAQNVVEAEAKRAGAYYINQRWLGGLLTNFQTIQGRIEKLIKLEDQIAKGELQVQTKRETQSVQTEVARLNKYLGGIKEMTRLPSVIFMVDIGKEEIAVHEATRLKIPVVAIVDTNCDPDRVQYPIPANDDAVRSIGLIAAHIADAIIEGRALSQKVREDKMAAEAELEAMEIKARSEAQATAAARLEAPVATAEALREAEEDEANQPRTSP
jgi:small subunit ribosomal protein S2